MNNSTIVKSKLMCIKGRGEDILKKDMRLQQLEEIKEELSNVVEEKT